MHFRKLMAIPLAALVLSIGLMTMGCDETNNDANDQRKEAVQSRAETFERAQTLIPVPQTENFPLRAELVRFTERQDIENHPTYVYVLADTGQILGYYVAKTFPLNICAFLSSSEDVYNSSWGNLTMTAPSLDGIYYGGAGAGSTCDGWFFFDQETDALIELIGMKIWVADQPLNVEAEPLAVRQ